jgi:hypothetical protein
MAIVRKPSSRAPSDNEEPPLETIITMRSLRPALLIRDGKFQLDEAYAQWSDVLESHRATLEKPSGQLDAWRQMMPPSRSSALRSWSTTGWR